MAELATALDAALAYASRGWFVFPVQVAPNKRPLSEHGFRDATTDHARIVAWWTQWPAAQVGIDCGRSGLVTVDLDKKPDVDGQLQWDLMEIEHGSAGCGLAMSTPRGPGKQLFFADPGARCRRRLGVRPGVDLLGDGGYTIVPSPASPGRFWSYGDPFEVEDLVQVPDWVACLDERQRADAARAPLAGGANEAQRFPALQLGWTPLTDDQVRDIRAALAWIPNDGRDEWLRVGFALKATSAGEQAYDLWCEWSRMTPTGGLHPKFNEKDQRYTWEHATELRADGREVTLSTLFYMAIDRGYQGPVPDDLEPVQITLHDAATGEDTVAPASASAPAEHRITLLDWEDVAQMPPVEWMIEGLLPRQSLSLLVGDTEAGKTFSAIDLAMRLVHGLPWCGREVQPCSVLYLAGEGQHGLAGRFRAWRYFHQHLGLNADGRYCVVSSEIPLLSKRTMHLFNRLVDTVAEQKGHPPGIIIIDTLSQGLEEDENEAKVVAPVLRGLVALIKRYGSSVMVNHHLVKLNTKLQRGQFAARPTRDSVRGSSALTRNVDTVLGLVVTDEAGGRELQVWKQKDGEKLPPIKLMLTPTETGRRRTNTYAETSCVMTLAPELPALKADPDDDDRTDPLVNEHAIEQVERALASVVKTLTKIGCVEGLDCKAPPSSNAVAKLVGRNKELVRTALEHGVRKGSLKNIGKKSKFCWVVTKKALEQDETAATVNA